MLPAQRHNQSLFQPTECDVLYDKAAEEWHLEIFQGFPHGMPTAEADTINADLLAFLKGIFKVAA